MGELIYGTDEPFEVDTPLARVADTIRELGGVPLRLLARIDSRHLDTLIDRPPTPSEALRALHAERGDHLPPGALAA